MEQTMQNERLTVNLTAMDVPEGWMIGPKSYLVDRIVPDVERVWLPQTQTGGGVVQFLRGNHVFQAPPKGRLSRLKSAPQAETFDDDKLTLDLRWNTPANWAHFLMDHLTVLAMVLREFQTDASNIRVLLPADTPSYIRKLVTFIGLNVHFSDAPVNAYGIQFEIEHWNFIRGERGTILRDPSISPLAAKLALPSTLQETTPDRIFLARRGTRAIENNDEIAALLQQKGFALVFPEDLDTEKQIRTLLNAKDIVAVHGASLAPLFYQTTTGQKLVEIFPVGHITNVYRAMAHDIGAQWCGVRGLIDKQNLSEIYKFSEPYTKHSLNNFRVDPTSLEVALQQVGLD